MGKQRNCHSPLQRVVFKQGGDHAPVVNSGDSPAVGAYFEKPAGYWQHALLPVKSTESSAQEKESGICQQKTRKLRDKVREHVSLWWPEKNSSSVASQL